MLLNWSYSMSIKILTGKRKLAIRIPHVLTLHVFLLIKLSHSSGYSLNKCVLILHRFYCNLDVYFLIVLDFDCLRERGYTNAIPLGAFTNISNKNMKGSRTYDHIWLTKETRNVASGNFFFFIWSQQFA
jgi:hypothetical protein